MSNMITPLLYANFEDYDKYDEVSCTLKHFPDMWEQEIQAEAGVYEEQKRLREQMFFMARDSVQRTIMHFKNMKAKHSYIAELVNKAMCQLAEEYGWKVKNSDSIKYRKVSPIIRTSLLKYEDDSMDLDFDVVFPIKRKRKEQSSEHVEQYMTPLERIHYEGKQQFPDKRDVVSYALVELAAVNGWKPVSTDPHRPFNTKVYKI